MKLALNIPDVLSFRLALIRKSDDTFVLFLGKTIVAFAPCLSILIDETFKMRWWFLNYKRYYKSESRS